MCGRNVLRRAGYARLLPDRPGYRHRGRICSSGDRGPGATVAFLNLGYGHEQFPAFLKACADVREGRETSETRKFVWIESGQDAMDRGKAPSFSTMLTAPGAGASGRSATSGSSGKA